MSRLARASVLRRQLPAALAALTLLATTVAFAAPPPTPGPVGQTYKVGSLTRTWLGYYKRYFPQMKLDAEICEGPVPAARAAEAKQLLNDISRALRSMRTANRRVPANDKRVAWVAQRWNRMVYAQRCAQSLAKQPAVTGAAAAPAAPRGTVATPSGTTAPPAGGLSRQSKNFIKNFDANFGRLKDDPEICGGQYPMAKKRAATDYRMSLTASLGFTKRAARSVPANERGVPAVKQRLERLNRLIACDQAIAKRDKVLKKGMAEIKARYWAFMKETTPYSRDMRTLIPMTGGDTVRFVTTAAEVTQKSNTLKAVHALCTGKYKGIQNDPRYGHSDERNPEKWCAAAAKRTFIIESLVRNAATSQTKTIVRIITKATDELEQVEGYIRISGVGEQALYDLPAVKKIYDGRLVPLFQAAGMTKPADLYASLDAAVAALWAKVVKLGPTWKSPKKDGGGPAAGIARKQLRKVKTAGKVLKSYTTRGSFKIIKNAFGIPLRRTKPGYVQYKSKVKRGWCVSRGFTYTETFDGRRYVKPAGVPFGYHRYMKCGK